jgi:hypothetical protein
MPSTLFAPGAMMLLLCSAAAAAPSSSETSAAVKHTASASITNRVLVFPKGLLGFHTFKPPSLLQIPETDALFAFANGRLSSLDATADNIIMRKSTDAGRHLCL